MNTMKTLSGLALSTLLGLALTGTLSAPPAYADQDQKYKHTEEELNLDPMPLSYPQAAPGSLNLYHWKDYTETEMEAGSVNAMRRDKEHQLDKERHERMKEYRTMYHRSGSDKDGDEEDLMWDPMPMSYPHAAPGSLHLYHWKDYTKTEMEAGSVADKRWEMRHNKDKERHEEMKENGMSK